MFKHKFVVVATVAGLWKAEVAAVKPQRDGTARIAGNGNCMQPSPSSNV